MWAMTHNVLWIGAIGLATALPILLIGPIGGNLADRYDRRRIVRITTLLQVVSASGLSLQAYLGNESPMLILALVSANAGAGALGAPARRSLPARLLPASRLGGAFALLNLSFQFSMLAGPALGGLLVAWAVPAAYSAQLIAAVASLLSLGFLPPIRPQSHQTESTGAGRGWSIIFRKRTLQGAFATDIAATALAMPISVFPLLNDVYFDDDPRTLGLFLSAIAVGGILAGLLSGQVARAQYLGRIMIVSALLWSLGLVLVSVSSILWVTLLLLAIAGAADTVAVISRGMLIQLETPDRTRGRVSAAEQIIGVAAPEIGNFRGGVIASVTGGPASILIGGATAFITVVVLAVGNSSIRSYRAPS